MLFKLQSIFYGFLKKLDMNSRNRGPDITTVVNVRTNLKFLNEHDRLRREYFFLAASIDPTFPSIDSAVDPI